MLKVVISVLESQVQNLIKFGRDYDKKKMNSNFQGTQDQKEVKYNETCDFFIRIDKNSM